MGIWPRKNPVDDIEWEMMQPKATSRPLLAESSPALEGAPPAMPEDSRADSEKVKPTISTSAQRSPTTGSLSMSTSPPSKARSGTANVGTRDNRSASVVDGELIAAGQVELIPHMQQRRQTLQTTHGQEGTPNPKKLPRFQSLPNLKRSKRHSTARWIHSNESSSNQALQDRAVRIATEAQLSWSERG